MVEALPVAPQNDVADVLEPSNEEPRRKHHQHAQMADSTPAGPDSDARQIYETILHRDRTTTSCAESRSIGCSAAAKGRGPKVMKLEAWLARAARPR